MTSAEATPSRASSRAFWRAPLVLLALVLLIGASVTAVLLRSRASEPAKLAPPPPVAVVPVTTSVQVDVPGAPEGLTVRVDGQPATLPLVLARGPQVHALLFEAPGFEAQEIRLDASRDRSLVLQMTQVHSDAAAPTTKPARPSPRRAKGSNAFTDL